MAKLDIYLKNSSYSFLGKIIRAITGFVYVWILNQILSPSEYGSYVLGFTIVSITTLIVGGGFSKLLLYKIPKLDDNDNLFSGNILLVEIIVSVLIMILFWKFNFVFSDIFNNQDLGLWIKALSPIILFNCIKQFYSDWLRSKQRIFENITLNEIVFPILRIILFIIIFFISDSPYLIASGIALSMFLSVIKWLKKDQIWRYFNLKTLDKDDWVYNFQLMLTRLLNKFINQMDILMIGFLLTSSMVAEYKIAWKFAALIRYGDLILTNIFVPRISNYFSENKIKQFISEFNMVREITLLVGILTSLFLIIFGDYMIIFFGNYDLAYKILLIFICGWIFDMSFTNVGNTLQMAGEGKLIMYNHIFLFILNFFGNYFLIQYYGVYGAVIATVSSQILINLFQYIQGLIFLNLNLYSIKILFITMISFSSILIGVLNTDLLYLTYIFNTISIFILAYGLKDTILNIIFKVVKG